MSRRVETWVGPVSRRVKTWVIGVLSAAFAVGCFIAIVTLVCGCATGPDGSFDRTDIAAWSEILAREAIRAHPERAQELEIACAAAGAAQVLAVPIVTEIAATLEAHGVAASQDVLDAICEGACAALQPNKEP